MENAIRVLDDASAVGVALTPIRRRLVSELGEDESATSLAARLGLSRQKVNYHLRALEKAGIVELVEERPRRGFVERIYRLGAREFVVDPAVLGRPPKGAAVLRDRFSSAYLVVVAARLISEVAALRERAARAGKKLLTQTLETEVRFDTPRDFEAFTGELVREMNRLVKKYSASRQRGGRRYRFVLGAHPVTKKE